jgi:hypothetical protein
MTERFCLGLILADQARGCEDDARDERNAIGLAVGFAVGYAGINFYDLVISSLRAAEMLAGACPAETALTPVGRMATLRARLDAARAATAAIRPAFTHFFDDQAQQGRFAAMN